MMLICTTPRLEIGPFTTPSTVATPVGRSEKSMPDRSSPAATLTGVASCGIDVPGKKTGAKAIGRAGIGIGGGGVAAVGGGVDDRRAISASKASISAVDGLTITP